MREKAISQSRRKFLQAAVLTTGSAILAACGEQAAPLQKIESSVTQVPESMAATVTASVGKTYFPSGDSNIPDAFTAPLPAFQSVQFVPGRGGPVEVFTLSFLPLPTPRENNSYWQELEKRLNVKWNVSFASGPDVYREKVSTLLASGKLADLFHIEVSSAPSLNPALQQGAFHDLSSYLTDDALKDYPNLARIPPVIWQNAAINGKTYGPPRPRILTGSVVVYRKDWAKKVGITNPQNADEFFELLQAFRKGNLAGNGSETWPISFVASGVSSLTFFMELFNVPNVWRQEPDGKLTYFTETEEYKRAVEYMRKVFAADLFYPDSASLTRIQLQRNFISGKTGMYHAGLNGYPILRDMFRQAKVEADADVIVSFGADGGKGSHRVGVGHFGVTGIPSSISDPERIKELLRIVDYLSAPYFSVENNFLLYDIDGVHSKADTKGIRKLTEKGIADIQETAATGNGPYTFYFPEDLHVGPQMQDITRKLLAMAVYNPAVNIYSPAQAKHSGQTRQAWPVARVDEIPPGKRKLVEADGRSIGIFNVHGTFVAVLNICPHAFAPVCRGRVGGTTQPSSAGQYRWGQEGEILFCPWHGWEFELLTGKSLVDRRHLTLYPVHIENETIFVSLKKKYSRWDSALQEERPL